MCSANTEKWTPDIIYEGNDGYSQRTFCYFD